MIRIITSIVYTSLLVLIPIGLQDNQNNSLCFYSEIVSPSVPKRSGFALGELAQNARFVNSTLTKPATRFHFIHLVSGLA
ncbi:MAG: hypothetical protein EHM93_03265 [Bacteroidales bacterium]|nr:MAG: hypothetical protein EHM93_03265 [Bacteroidales bacterium]